MVSDEIADWFERHSDGEFVPAGAASSVGDPSAASRVLFTTKPQMIARACQCLGNPEFDLLLSFQGLPNEAMLRPLLPQEPGARAFFLGDADPPDLLIFAWLRERWPVEWLGLNDRLLGAEGVQQTTQSAIRLSPSEIAGRERLKEWVPDYKSLLGPGCAELLAQGAKFELECLLWLTGPEFNRRDDP